MSVENPITAGDPIIPVGSDVTGEDLEAGEVEDGARSSIERLRGLRDRIGSSRSEVFEIPGYNGELVARYGIVPWGELKRLGQKAERSKNPRKELITQADTLIMACQEIMIRDQQGELQKLIPESEPPLRYDDRLAKILGFTASKAREVLSGTISNDIAISAHHNEVVGWMEDTSSEDDEEFLGESKAGER